MAEGLPETDGEAPPPTAAQNLLLQTQASGRFDRADTFWLLDPADVDAVRESPLDYPPPGG
ncbi:MAG: hypothetical protein ACKV2O_15295 [Acidimicrobiales bacterium]